MEGKAFIFSAPSGSGKTTIVNHLLASRSDLEFSISATTRPPRGSEIAGKHYYFLTEQDFKARIAQDALVEWEEVYEGRYYGTLKEELERIWSADHHVVFDVDVVGGVNLKKKLGDRACSIFVKAEPEVIASRLRGRATDTEEEVRNRLAKMEHELTYAAQFDKIIINDVLDVALSEAEMLVEAFIQS